MWTKLRPGVREMLRRASQRFELWIHTAGSRSYAAAMAELLGAHYFGQRIIAQQDGAEELQVGLRRVHARVLEGSPAWLGSLRREGPLHESGRGLRWPLDWNFAAAPCGSEI
jgi:hypothetical protein